MSPKAATHLMFVGEATAALELYAAVFPGSRVQQVERYQAGQAWPAGTIKVAEASLLGHRLVVGSASPGS